jgi:hypothetical protein
MDDEDIRPEDLPMPSLVPSTDTVEVIPLSLSALVVVVPMPISSIILLINSLVGVKILMLIFF